MAFIDAADINTPAGQRAKLVSDARATLFEAFNEAKARFDAIDELFIPYSGTMTPSGLTVEEAYAAFGNERADFDHARRALGDFLNVLSPGSGDLDPIRHAQAFPPTPIEPGEFGSDHRIADPSPAADSEGGNA